MVVTIFARSKQFLFERLNRADIGHVLAVVSAVAERTHRTAHVMAFEVDGHVAGGHLLEGPHEGLTVYQGRPDAGQPEWLGVGRDAVVWVPPSEEWACALISERWGQTQVCWAVLVDERSTAEVVRDMQAMWPRSHGRGT